LCNIVKTKGATAEIPVDIRNSFNFPFSFLEINISIIPSIRNINPNIATNGKNALWIAEGKGIKKQINKRMKMLIKE